jgi:hypothetical protein
VVSFAMLVAGFIVLDPVLDDFKLLDDSGSGLISVPSWIDHEASYVVSFSGSSSIEIVSVMPIIESVREGTLSGLPHPPLSENILADTSVPLMPSHEPRHLISLWRSGSRNLHLGTYSLQQA